MSSIASIRIDLDGNSLPVAGKSNGRTENAATELIYIPFWDNPIMGSILRADGCSRARPERLFQAYD
jgi:hypothetical protein